MVSKQSAQDHYVAVIAVVTCSDRHTSKGNWSSTGAKCRTHDLLGHEP